MGARRVEDLVIWQLAHELRVKVHAVAATTPACEDRRFRDQVVDAASSITRNIAEGFGRYRHKEFAHYLAIARGSLFELADHLKDGISRQHWTAQDIMELDALCNRT